MGMKPYYIKRSVSNDSIYCYRYYFTDPDAGYDRAFNYYVDFSETELSVRSIHYNEIEYSRVILNVGDKISEPVDDEIKDTEEDSESEDDSEESTEDTETEENTEE